MPGNENVPHKGNVKMCRQALAFMLDLENGCTEITVRLRFAHNG